MKLSLHSLLAGIWPVGLAILAATPASAVPVPAISTSGGATYIEASAATAVAPGLTISGGAPYVNGALEFSVTSATSTEQLGIATSTSADVTLDAVSVVGRTVYLGDGTAAAAIGEIDATSDGTAGKALKINFSNAAFANSSFEDGTSSGWDVTDARIIINGTNTIAGWVIPSDSTPNPTNGFQTSPGDAASASMSYGHSISTNVATGGVNGAKSLNLTLSGQVGVGGGVVRGPYAVSASSFAVTSGDTISFWWSAAAAGDAYDVFGYLLNVDNGHTQVLLNATGSSGSATQAWKKETVTVAETGNYKFIFISGSFDFSFGQALGANLLIDNVQSVSANSPVNNAVVQAIGRLVTYRDTSANPATTRTIGITITNTAGQSASATQSLGVTPVNTPPVVSGASAISYTLRDNAAVLSNGITITDPDDTELASASVAVTTQFTAGDVLSLTTDTGTMGGITATYDSAQGVLSLTGTATLLQYRAALRAVKFASSSASIATRTITFSVTDAASTAAGAQSADTTTTVSMGAPAPVITSATTAAATYGTSFTYAITASSLIPVDGFTAGTLPAGLSIDTAQGVISGIPAQVGVFNVAVTAVNATGASSPASVEITIAPKAITISGLTVDSRSWDLTSNATFNTSGATLVGLVAGDIVTLDSSSATGTFADAAVSENKSVTAAGFALTGAAAANYVVVQPTGLTGRVVQRAQDIYFPAMGEKQTTDAAFAMNAFASSGLPLTFTVVSGPAMLNGATVTLTGATGVVVIRASQAGDASYSAAASVVRQFEVKPVGPQVFFGKINEGASQSVLFRALSTTGDDIAANIAKDNSSGTIIGYLAGAGQGFVLNFAPKADGSFEGTAEVYSGKTTAAANDGIRVRSVSAPDGGLPTATVTIRGTVINGIITGTLVGRNVTFSATMQPQSGPTAPIAGYYIAPSTNTASGATYAVVGTDARVYVLAIAPGSLASGEGSITAAGAFSVNGTGGDVIDGTINPGTTEVTGTLRNASNSTAVTFGGIKATTLRTDRLINLSSRSPVGVGERILITGFIIGGSTPKPVLVRAVGPSLSSLGVAGAMADPELSIYQGSTLVARNDNWSDNADAAKITSTGARIGAFDLKGSTREAALLLTLAPGVYSAQVSGHGGTGVALAEIYDASENPQADYQRLINISSRGYVTGVDGPLIGGFVVTGNSPKRLLIRGVGPTLSGFGVKDTLADPSLRIMRDGVVIAQNNDWSTPITIGTSQVAATSAQIADASALSGAFALAAGARDAAVIVTLPPGLYSAAVTGSAGATGIALVEIYEIP